MADFTEVSQFPETVERHELVTPVLGGDDLAPSNLPLKRLVDRTRYLKNQIVAMAQQIADLEAQIGAGDDTLRTELANPVIADAQGANLVAYKRNNFAIDTTVYDYIHALTFEATADFGVPNDGITDAYASIQAMFNYLQNFAQGKYEGIRVNFAAGSYLLSQVAICDLQANNLTGQHALLISGAGQDQTFFIASAANTTGCLKLTSTGVAQTYEIRDCAFLSPLAHNAATHNGIALEISQAPIGGVYKKPTVRIRNIHIGAKDSGDLSVRAYGGNFLKGIYLENKWWPVLQNVWINGPKLDLVYDSVTNAPLYTPTGRTHCIHMLNCYSPMMDKIYTDGYWTDGIYLQGKIGAGPSDQDVEDFRLMDSFLVGQERGFYMDHDDGQAGNVIYEPGGAIVGCHVNSKSQGIIINYHRQVVIDGCYIFVPAGDGAPNFTGVRAGIWLAGCSDVIIGNTLFGSKGFYIDDDNTSVGVRISGVCYALITGCTFTNGGIGVRTAPDATGNVQLINPTVEGQKLGLWAPSKLYLDLGRIITAQYVAWGPSATRTDLVLENARNGGGAAPLRIVQRSARSDYATNSNPPMAEWIAFGPDAGGTERLIGSHRMDWASNAAGNSKLKGFGLRSYNTTQLYEYDASTLSTGQTCFLISMNKNGTTTFERVMIGAADSAGAGRRALYVPN
jgi:hypothetical protein